MTNAEWVSKFLVGWALATVGAAVATYGLQAAVEGSASFAKHLANWSTISSGALLTLVGVGAIVHVVSRD